MISSIIQNYGIEFFGVCSFEKVADCLIECRAKMRLPKNPKSIICMLFPYLSEVQEHNVSRYCIPCDYHIIVNEYLDKISNDLKNKYSNFTFSYFCDNSPIPEKKAALYCGLGVLGDNTLLINKKFGSWVFIGEIVTDMKIDCSDNKIEGCLHCGLCKEKCPTKVLEQNKFDKTKCLSFITQKKKNLTDNEIELIRESNCAWGCDICQEVCPMNKDTKTTTIKYFLENKNPIINIGDYDILKNKAFMWRPKEVIERNISILNSQNGNNNS